MAQVISSSHLLQTKRAGFQCRYSPLNPATRPIFSASMVQTIQPTLERTRTHITNLEKLLKLEAKPKQQFEPIEPKPKPELKANPKSNTSKERAILGGFNLAQIWSDAIQIQANEATEISPRRLSRLQRLLSKKPEYSPRNLLGQRWREYHGSRDWAGLLDPLDENLRREVVRYGEFIQAAYQSFHSEPATTQDSINSRAQVNLPDKSYKVTKSLYATSSIGLPKWVDDVAPDLGWMTQRSSWVGYVAVCEDEREIARMGRRDIIIALRGTATCLEWAENFRIAQVPMENKSNSDSDSTQKDQSKVECGFLSLLRTKGEYVPSLADSVVQEIKTLLEKYKGETLSITITGHSLGAALALLVADEVSSCGPEVPPVAVFSFGGPRVGNRPYANRIKNKNVKVLRIVNNQDLITKVPGMFMNEELEEKLMKNMAWAYSHVGAELRVDTKKSPYLKPDADVACCHDLEAYLHLVDGFIASNCPFRENAKRSLVKLLSEQGSNVKKLYMSKSKSFTLKLYTSRSKSFALRIERDGIVATTSDCMPSPSQS